MKLNDINPFIRQAIISKLPSSIYTGKKIKTRDCRLFYILHGSGEILIEGRNYNIKAGSVILFQTGTEYVWQISDMRYVAINFDYTQEHCHIKTSFSPISADKFPSQNFSSKIDFTDATELNREIVIFDGAAFESRIVNLAVEINTAIDFKDELLSSLLKSIIISIVRQKREQESSGDVKGALLARRVIGFIQENYNKPIKSEDIAEQFHFNPSYVNRVFKAHTGFTVRTFIVDYRISQAMELLRSQNLSVSETASAVGFTDVPHFIKTFKSHVGQTPTEFRNQGTQKSDE
jgi:AraC-like DNA-binding protein